MNPLMRILRPIIVATLVGVIAAAAAGCGQRGPLYLPDRENPEKRR